jgi:hypothetical protein
MNQWHQARRRCDAIQVLIVFQKLGSHVNMISVQEKVSGSAV